MNIHINKKQFEMLNKSVLFSARIGSHMYGTNNENSDVDILHIYALSKAEEMSFVKTHHQYQYKNYGVDYIFVNIDAFIRNSLSGDSTINFELIHSFAMSSDPMMSDLYDMRHYFCNYKVVRSYLGLAKRDLKHMNRDKGDRLRNKKIAHAMRGYHFAYEIMEGVFDPFIKGVCEEEIKKINATTDQQEREVERASLDLYIKTLRGKLNAQLETDNLEIAKYMHVQGQVELDKFLFKLKESNFYKERQVDDLLFPSVYEANENDVKY